jgi:hypothetical protein
MNATVDKWDGETMTLAEKMQADCHQLVEKIMSDDPKVGYMDATMIFVFNKLAEIQLMIENIPLPQTHNK